MRPELMDGTWHLRWETPEALATAVVWGLALLCGWASLRYLRAAPDMARKREMLWGARWMGPLGLGWFILVTAASGVGIARTAYPFTFMRLSYLGFVGILPLLLLLPQQTAGWVACWHGLASQLRRRPPEWVAWAEKQEAASQILHRRWLLFALFIPVFVVWSYITFTDYVRVDLSSIQLQQEQSLAQELDAELAGVGLEEVLVILYTEPHRVAARMKQGASQEALQESVERIRQALAERNARGRWLISVYGPDGSRAHGSYPAEAAPPGGKRNAD